MKIQVYQKNYFKQSAEIKNAILLAVKTLYERIQEYEKQGTSFERIFNDDYIKYDKMEEFCTFKFRKGTVQLRIVYAYLIVEGESCIVVVDFVTKKKNNKSYVRQFAKYSSVSAMEALKNSVLVEEC